jgi:hypothetical protein
VARPVEWIQSNGKLSDSLAQLFICVGNSNQDRFFGLRDEDKVNEGGGREWGGWSLFNWIFWSQFLSSGQGISCTVLVTWPIANGVRVMCQLF